MVDIEETDLKVTMLVTKSVSKSNVPNLVNTVVLFLVYVVVLNLALAFL
jgi:hypothetical protein